MTVQTAPTAVGAAERRASGLATAPAATARRLVKSAVSKGRGDLVLLRFRQGGREFAAWCPDDETFTLARELVLGRVYERAPVRLADCGGTVVDAGAHVGIFTLQAARWATRVVAIEANPRNHAVLTENLRRNGVEHVDARLCALWWTSHAALEFLASPHSGGGVVAEAGTAPGPGAVRVGAVSIDDLVEELGPIDLLKIDVEGGEHEALAAATRLSQIRRIVGEIHLDSEDDQRLGALLRVLDRAGFATRVVSERELYGVRELPRFVANWPALRGRWLTKAIGAAYLAAPIKKPIRSPGAAYALPVLVAWRRRATDRTGSADV